MNRYETLFLGSLALTAALEMLATAILKRAAGKRLGLDCTYARLIGVTALASILTLPYVWFVLPAFLPKGPVFIAAAEIFALALEAAWYVLALKISVRRALILSAAANAFSFLAGLFIIRQ